MLKSPLGDADDLVQAGLQSGLRRWLLLLLLLLGFQEQLGLVQKALARRCFGIAPSVVECGGLPRGPVLLGESICQLKALLEAHSRHRRQVAHGQLRAELPFADLLLDGIRQHLDQRQAACHPGCTAVETLCRIFDRIAEPCFHLREQPALFQRAVWFAHTQRAVQQQRVGFAHVPDHGLDRVAA